MYPSMPSTSVPIPMVVSDIFCVDKSVNKPKKVIKNENRSKICLVKMVHAKFVYLYGGVVATKKIWGQLQCICKYLLIENN